MRSRGSPERNKIRIRTKRNKTGIMERSPKASARQRGRVDILDKITIGRNINSRVDIRERKGVIYIREQRVVVNKIVGN